MSTTIPESVSTQNTAATTTTTTTTTTADPTTTTSSTLSHHDNPAAALDPLTSQSSSAGSTASEILHQAKAAAIQAGAAIQSAAVSAGAAISSTAHNVDAKFHISDKMSDATSHVTTALKHGNVAHAAKHATTAATIGEAERAKHAAGPLPPDAHSAATSSATVTQSSAPGMSQTTTEKISNAASDVAAHVSASLAQGHPVHAAKHASTAAIIGQAEMEKHAHGLLEDETAIKEAISH